MRRRGHLLRILGLGFGMAAVVGSVIGQGILRSPGVVANATGSRALIITLWVASAVISCLNAFAWVELGAALPRAGGAYAFVRRAFGGKAGLLAAFALLVSLLATGGFLNFVVGEFLVRLGVGGGSISPGVFGVGALLLYALVNASGTRISGFSQILLSSAKALTILGLVIALFAAPGAAPESQAHPAMLRDGWLPLGTALMVTLSTYGGWWNLSYYGEEMQDPGHAVPRAMFGGILGVAALYIVVNLAMLHVMTPNQMAGSNLVAADAAGIVFGPQGDFLLTCFGVLSVGAVANLSLMTTTRLTYAIARAGILPRVLSVVGRRGTPIRAMLMVVAAVMLLILTGSYLTLVSLSATIFLPVMIAVAVAVIVLRKKEPDLARPYRVPFYPWTLYLSIAVILALMTVYIAQDPFYSLMGFVLVATMWLLFEIGAWFSGKPGYVGDDVDAGDAYSATDLQPEATDG